MCAQQLRVDTCYSPKVFVNTRSYEVAPFRCRSWRCSTCRPRKAKELARRIASAAATNHLTTLITLTIDPSLSSGHHLDHLWTAWRRLRDQYAREHPGLKAVAIVELHKSGVPHLHVLTTLRTPQRTLSDRWRTASNGSYIVDIRHVRAQAVARYVTKYLTKDTPSDAIPRGRRRYNASWHLLPAPPSRPDSPWLLGELHGTPKLLTTTLAPTWCAVRVEIRLHNQPTRIITGSVRLANVIGLELDST